MRVAERLVVVFEGTPLRRRAEHDGCSFRAYHVDEYLQLILVVVPCAVAGAVLRLVVMPELHKDIVAGLQRLEYLVEAQRANKRAGGEPAFRVVGNGHPGAEPARNHLAPRSPRLVVLVYHGGVAAEIDGRHLVVALYVNASDGRQGAVELQCETVVPCEVVLFALFYFHTLALFNKVCSLIDNELHGRGFFLLAGCYALGHQPAALGTHGGVGIHDASQLNAHAVVSVGHAHREVIGG